MRHLSQWRQTTWRNCYRCTNQFGEAEPLMRSVLATYVAAVGAQDPSVTVCLNNLAALLLETNRLQEADPMLWRALAIDEAAFGAQHPRVANILNNLSRALKETNRNDEAEPLMRLALEICTRSPPASNTPKWRCA